MGAEAGATAQSCTLISAGVPGMDCGSRLFETMSKIPALARSAKRVVSKVRLKPSVCGSDEAGLKSATAMRMLVTPLEVSVLKVSCARMTELQARKNSKAASQRNRACRMGDVRFRLSILSYVRRKVGASGCLNNGCGGSQRKTA